MSSLRTRSTEEARPEALDEPARKPRIISSSCLRVSVSPCLRVSVSSWQLLSLCLCELCGLCGSCLCGSCHRGSCHRGSCLRGSCLRGSLRVSSFCSGACYEGPPTDISDWTQSVW